MEAQRIPHVLTVTDVAEFLRVSTKTARRMVKSLPHRQDGRIIRISRRVLIDWIEGKEDTADEKP